MKQGQIWLLRHGECEGGAILRGRTDVPLTPLGWQQMQQAVTKLNINEQRIYCSPLVRTRAFATSLCGQGQTPWVLAGLQEIDFGDWDGCGFDEVYRYDSAAFDAYWQDPWSHPAPKGETMAMFESRVERAFNSIIQDLFSASEAKIPPTVADEGALSTSSASSTSSTSEPEAGVTLTTNAGKLSTGDFASALVVTHGGVIRHLMSCALGLSAGHGLYRQLDLPYGALVRISVLEDDNGNHHLRLHWSDM